MELALNNLPKIDYGNHPAYGGMLEPDRALGEQALQTLRPLIDEMTQVEAERMQRFGYRYGHATQADLELVTNSFTRGQLSSAQMDRVEAAAQPYLTLLQERLREPVAAGQAIPFRMVNQMMSADSDPEIWGAVDRAMREAGVYDTVALFFNATSGRLKSLAVFVNPPNQSWVGAPFRDLDIGMPPTAGMHIDSNGKCYLKAILYLNEVGPDQGPTCVIPASHEWDCGGVERIRRRAFDRSKLLGRSAGERQLFISLPKEFQVKAEFGGDLLPDSPETKALLDSEFCSVGDRGTYTLFNPESVHRGGAVRSGERRALQITLSAQW